MDFGNMLERIKGAVRRAGAQISGDSAMVKRGNLSPESLEDRPLSSPAMDVFENDKEYLLRFDVPGATPKNTEVHFGSDHNLTIYVRDVGGNGKGPALFAEFEASDWYRAVKLTHNSDGDRASSVVKDGILTVRVPKHQTPAPKLIPVKADK